MAMSGSDGAPGRKGMKGTSQGIVVKVERIESNQFGINNGQFVANIPRPTIDTANIPIAKRLTAQRTANSK